MRLFIAEKPSLGCAIAENIGHGIKKDGYISLNNGKDIVTWCFGHILTQLSPDEYDEKYKSWNINDLPIIPSTWKLKVKKDSSKQFKIIKNLVEAADMIVNAGDPDREGQLLIDEVLEYLENKKPVKRIMLNALDEKSVKSALKDLQDNEKFIGLRDSAKARSYADWLIGMNLSRAYTLKGQAAGYPGVIHVGRVQTPTLALIVRRENAIKNFSPIKHYVIKITWKHDNGSIITTWKHPKDIDGVDNEERLIDKRIGEALIDKIQTVSNNAESIAHIVSVEKKLKKEGQRHPYSLSTLQVEAGRKYGISPQQVLDCMQELYEKKLTTYPRSDCEYLPTNQLDEASIILCNISKIANISDYISGADINIISQCWNDKKISAHHAIIPTTVPVNYDSLSDIQKKLYLMVATAYLAQFYPIHTYVAKKITITSCNEQFIGTGKTVQELGWKKLYQNDNKTNIENDVESILPNVIDGDQLEFESGKIQEKITTPPKHFTEATLLQAMKEIYKYVKNKDIAPKLKECKGIGTEATRASIIELLKTAGFVNIDKKYMIPTEKGRMAIDNLPDEITYPDLTAVWEAALDSIAEGKHDISDFLSSQEKIIIKLLDFAEKSNIKTNKDAVLCPNCNKPMIRKKGKSGYFWGCSGYPNCHVIFIDKNGHPDVNNKISVSTGKTVICPICGKKLRQIKGKFSTFWGCNNKDCNASFSDHDDAPVIIHCPNCYNGYLKRAASKINKGKFYWYCSNKCGIKTISDKNGLPDISK